MKRYSHQFLIAFTVESGEEDPWMVGEAKLAAGLTRRLADILEHDGLEAYEHNDTEEI